MKSGEFPRLVTTCLRDQPGDDIFTRYPITMFIGEYKHSLDDKGRVAMPAKFRALLKDGAVVTRNVDNCLTVYPKKVFENLAKKLAALPSGQADSRAYARFVLTGAAEVNFDGQGRISLPEYLRSFAKLGKVAVIAGLFDKLEIWNEEDWERYKAGAEKNSQNIAENLSEWGI